MFYQERHEAKGAVIGTIMAWTGGLSGIPAGWKLCDGTALDASDYPLLASSIGDSYNMGSTSNFDGTFPSYTGLITLPDLNGKMLMDLEKDYFALTGRDADNDSDALVLLDSTIGNKTSNTQQESLASAYTDITTDIIFEITQGDREGYQGKITGNVIVPGEGTKTVYVAPRKLGRKHVNRHNHSGTIPTIDNAVQSYPGEGVVPYYPISYTLYISAVDLDGGGDVREGDAIFFGWTDDTMQGRSSDNPTEYGELANLNSVNIRPGVIGGNYRSSFNVNESPGMPDILSYRWPEQGEDGFTSPDGAGAGTDSKIFGLVWSESPPVNMQPKELKYTPLASSFKSTTNHPDGYRIGGPNTNTIPYGPGGRILNVPAGIRNFFNENQPETDTSGRTLLDHPGYDFLSNDTGGGSPDIIYGHDHGTFDVEFDSSRLTPNSSIIANVNMPPTTNPDNTLNEGILNISFNTEQPKLTCIYIIRAY